MKLVSYLDGDRASYGAVIGTRLVDLPSADRSLPRSLREALSVDRAQLAEALANAEPGPEIAAVELLPVIPDPAKIVCVGVNYPDHRAETGHREVAHPTLFIRFADSQVGHDRPVAVPRASRVLDYEGELAVVIGAPAYEVPAARALEHVAGYACFDDLTIRDFQSHASQFTPGKNFHGVGAFGPWLVTTDEIPDPDALELETRVNGEVRQSAAIKDLIFSIPQLIAYITTFTPLRTGDVIVTGTPGGVGYFREIPLLLEAGDVVEVEVTGVGLLRTPIV